MSSVMISRTWGRAGGVDTSASKGVLSKTTNGRIIMVPYQEVLYDSTNSELDIAARDWPHADCSVNRK